MRTWVEIGGIVLFAAIIGGTFGVAQYQITELRGNVNEIKDALPGDLKETLKSLEVSRTSDHDTLVRMENDVRWIRQTMERQAK